MKNCSRLLRAALDGHPPVVCGGRGRTVPGVGPGAVPRGRAGAGHGDRTRGPDTRAVHGLPRGGLTGPGRERLPQARGSRPRTRTYPRRRGAGGGPRGARTALRTHLPCPRRGAATDCLKDGTDGTDGTDEPKNETDDPTDGMDTPNARPPPPGDASPLPRQRRWGGAA